MTSELCELHEVAFKSLDIIQSDGVVALWSWVKRKYIYQVITIALVVRVINMMIINDDDG